MLLCMLLCCYDASTAHCHVHSIGVQMEERQERCSALREGLADMQPRLSMLAEGKGRSAQLAARVCKSLDRCVPTEID